MMITGTVIGGEAAIARFNAMPGRLRQELVAGIGRAVLKLQARVKDGKLSDEVLHVRSGRLRRSITGRVTQDADRVTGIVGTNVIYGRVHEYGFEGVVTVREHLRRAVSGAAVNVRAHSRHMNLPQRSFLRTALAEMAPEIRTEFEQAVNRAVHA